MPNDQTPEIGTDEQETAIPEQTEETPQEQVEETTENPSEEVLQETPEESTETTEQTSPETTQPDYRQKFVESSRESILNHERAKVANARVEQLTKTDTPTDEAMRELYPEWDDLNEVTKKALVKQEAQEMRQRRIEAQQQEILDRQKLEDELETVIESNPKLAGKEAEFKRFAKSPKNKGISADVLAKAFLFDVEEETPPANVQREEVLPQGSGGSREPAKPKKISLEEAARIRETDYPKYLELVKNDQIEEIE